MADNSFFSSKRPEGEGNYWIFNPNPEVRDRPEIARIIEASDGIFARLVDVGGVMDMEVCDRLESQFPGCFEEPDFELPIDSEYLDGLLWSELIQEPQTT